MSTRSEPAAGGAETTSLWTASASTLTALIFLVASAPVSTAVADEIPKESPDGKIHDCRYDPVGDRSTRSGDGFVHRAFPRDNVFRPLLAAEMEPRFATNFGWTSYTRPLGANPLFDSYISSHVGLAGNAGFWSWRNPRTCDGLQVGIFGGAYNQFALDPLHLLNVDFRGGVEATGRIGYFAVQLRAFHQSSHLGDDFLEANPEHPVTTLSFESVEAVAAFGDTWWRLYAGGGWKLRVDPADLGRGSLQFGVEFGSGELARPSPIRTIQWAPLVGIHLHSYQARNWGIMSNAKVGAEVITPGQRRRLRLLATLMTGYTPFGIFFEDHRLTRGGLEVQFLY